MNPHRRPWRRELTDLRNAVDLVLHLDENPNPPGPHGWTVKLDPAARAQLLEAAGRTPVFYDQIYVSRLREAGLLQKTLDSMDWPHILPIRKGG
jgi:hypothetical protein